MRFTKLSGAGNDFILIDAARFDIRNPAKLARNLCSRRDSIGADGLLVVRPGSAPSAAYFNADGSSAFCGNGMRAAAWWLNRRAGASPRFLLKTPSGRIEVEVLGPSRARIRMPQAAGLRRGLRLTAAGRRFQADFIDTGVPHAVVKVPTASLSKIDIAVYGSALRRHPAFGRAGANVDFVSVLSPSRIAVRTYERGVEDETLACGTGAAAAAILSSCWSKARSPVSVEMPGGTLRVEFRRKGDAFDEIWLEGPVRAVFEGEVSR